MTFPTGYVNVMAETIANGGGCGGCRIIFHSGPELILVPGCIYGFHMKFSFCFSGFFRFDY